MSVVAPPLSPYKGLAAYDDSDVDALFFFGRERETEVIAANLQAARLTVLYGPSGVGKSSILRAGVARRLRQEPDAAVKIVDSWAGDAVTAIREAVDATPPDADVYLALDQFEEYFVYRHDPNELALLLGTLTADARSRVNVLVAIREDALAELDAFRRTVPHLLANRLQLDLLDRRAAREAILKPLERYKELTGDAVEIEPALVDRILGEVAAGGLELGLSGRGGANGAQSDRIEAPYLQLVLQTLWEAERAGESPSLRAETLDRLGGAARIVHEHLERAMAQLTPAEKQAAARMYDHLVTPSGTKIAQDAGDLARYASLPEEDAAQVLEKLARERILRVSSDDGAAAMRYEIFHDVLADAVLAWRARHEEQQALRDAERRRRRAFAVATAALVGLVLVAAIAVFALVERGHSRSQARRARAGELVAEARTALDVDPRQSVGLALQAARRERSQQVEDVLRDALIASRVRTVFFARHPVLAPGDGFFVLGSGAGDGWFLTSTPGGRILAQRRPADITAVASRDGVTVAGADNGWVYQLVTGGVSPFRSFLGGAITALALADGYMAAGSATGMVGTFWEEGVGLPRPPRLRLHVRGGVISLAFSPNGRRLLVVSHDRRARLIDVTSGRVVHTLAQRGFVNAAAFSPNGRIAVTASQDRTARIWDVRTGRLLHELTGATGGLTAVAFSSDGELVAIASSDGVARVYDLVTGAIRFYLSGDTNAINDIGFSPDGRALVTASSDRTVRVWTTDVGRQLAVLRGHTDAVQRAIFTSDGTRVVTAAADGTVRIWDPGTEPELRVLFRQQRRFAQASRGPDGTVTVVDIAGVRRVLDPTARHVIRTVRGAAPRSRRAEASRGDLSARAGPDDVVSITRNNRTLHALSASADALEFSPDGRLLAAAGHDHYLRVWDVQSGRLLYAVVAHQGPVEDVSFSPDGRWIVTAGPISAGVWRADTGRQLLLLHGPTQPLHAALFTRDGRTIVTAGYDGTIRSYDCVVCGTFPQLVSAGERHLVQTRPR
jgi:WD40 repeat protein